MRKKQSFNQKYRTFLAGQNFETHLHPHSHRMSLIEHKMKCIVVASTHINPFLFTKTPTRSRYNVEIQFS
jgi:hypothetical protein